MGNTCFYFIRHGETTANISGHLQGQLNSGLTENGMAQAQAVAEALKDEHFDHIFTSDLIRAADTAEAIRRSGHTDTPLTTTPVLREWFCGDLEGIRWDALGKEYPELSNAFNFETGDLRFPGGESRMEVQKRVADFLEETRKLYRGKKILLVSHGGILQRIFRHICGVIDDANLLPLCDNAAISIFCYNENRQAWQLTAWNRTEHLRGLKLHKTIVL